MAKKFMMDGQPQQNIYVEKYNNSRVSLLGVVIFTAINLLLLVTNTDTYFLFSAFIPFLLTYMGMIMCGRFPAEYYTDFLEETDFLDNSFFTVILIISIALTFLYFLAWLMSSKNRVGWLIFALVFFSLDTVGMLFAYGISLESIFDIIFHFWVICSLFIGIRAHFKFKKLSHEEKSEPVYDRIHQENEEIYEAVDTKTPNSFIIREANKDIKHRILLEAQVLDYNICYRRVKHTNELIINGNVYDEIEGVIEFPHTLKAQIDGHYISAGNNGSHSFISVDNEKVAKKLRIF